jgi:hypothetical protein
MIEVEDSGVVIDDLIVSLERDSMEKLQFLWVSINSLESDLNAFLM